MKYIKILALFLLATLVTGMMLSGCGKSATDDGSDEPGEISEPELQEYPVQVGEYTVLGRPRRVVSLSPALTEKLYDLGLEDRLVGVSNFCDYPSGADRLTKCGTAWMPDTEVIDELDAHMVISETPLPDEYVTQLREWDIDIVILPHAQSLDDLYNSYLSLCRIMEGEYAGAEMSAEFLGSLKAWVERLRQSLSGQERKKALYILKLPFVVATGDTLENDLMDVIGLDNVLADYKGWQIDETEARGDARALFESTEVMYFDTDYLTIKSLEQSDYYKSLQATLKDWYLEIDSTILERQSLRSFRLLLDMAAYAYPEAKLPPLQLSYETSPTNKETSSTGIDDTDDMEDSSGE